MQPEYRDWHGLIRSIHQNRASNALYYKPVCVIATIDLADVGGLVSDMLYAELIIRKFEQYVMVAFPKRASKGWWPLWFLANDGLWNFSRKGRLLSKTDLATRPTTKNKMLQRFDRQVIAPEYRTLWDSPDHRKVLRDHMLAIMNRYPECKLLVRALFDPNVVDEPDRWPSESAVDAYLNDLEGQGDLFQKGELEIDPAKPRNAAAVRKALSTFDVTNLPSVSPVGPSLEVTGVAPIARSPVPYRETTRVQLALYVALRQKCTLLDQLAASSNRAAHLRPALGDMVTALQSPPEQSNGYLIWSPGNTLRRLLAAELRGRDVDDPDDPLLTDRMRELLADVVEQFNVYATTDNQVGLLDGAKAGPESRSELSRSLGAGRAMVSALHRAPDIVNVETAQILEVTTQNAESATAVPGFDADQAIVNAVEIHRNSSGGILRNAALELKKFFAGTKGAAAKVGDGMLKEVGSEGIKGLKISHFVHSTKDAFIALWQGTTKYEFVDQFINLIKEFFSHFRS